MGDNEDQSVLITKELSTAVWSALTMCLEALEVLAMTGPASQESERAMARIVARSVRKTLDLPRPSEWGLPELPSTGGSNDRS